MGKVWYYKTIAASEVVVVGPFRFYDLKLLAREGTIGPRSFVREGAGGEWIAAIQVEELVAEWPASQASKPPTQGRAAPRDTSALLGEMSLADALKIALVGSVGLFLLIGCLFSLIAPGTQSTKSDRFEPVGMSDSERRAAEERFRREGMTPSEAKAATDDLDRFQKAEQERRYRQSRK